MTKLKIITWNFGKSSDEKIRHLQQFLTHDTSRPICVIGLQEVSGKEYRSIVEKLKSQIPIHYTLEYGFKTSSIFTSFYLLTIIVYHQEVSIENLSWKSKTIPHSPEILSFAVDTKGYLYADLTINDIQYTLVNVHLPFVNVNFTASNLESLFEFFRDRSNIIILGDFNTRSTIDDTCVANDTPCDNVNFKKNYKGKLTALETSLNLCRENNTSDICTHLKSKLLKKDFLTVFLSKQKVYSEGVVTFLPSYKVDPTTGMYSLSGKNKIRLAGYADRILVRGIHLKIIEDSYKMEMFTGNDHFPVVAEVAVLPFSGGRKTSMKCAAKLKIKTKKRISQSCTHFREEKNDKSHLKYIHRSHFEIPIKLFDVSNRRNGQSIRAICHKSVV